MSSPSARHHAAALALVVLVAGGVFANAIRSEFVWDDHSIIVSNAHIRRLPAMWQAFTRGYWLRVRADDPENFPRGYRPVAEISFALDWALWDGNVVGYHAVSIAIHAANCVLLYLVAYRLLGGIAPALTCALLFAAHPVHVEAVVWAKARSELLALFFMLLAGFCYVRYAGARRARSPAYLLAASLLAAVAAGAKASAIILPGLLALYVYCFVPRDARRRALWALLPLVAVSVAFMALDSTMPKRGAFVHLTPVGHVLTVVTTVGMSLRLLVLPVGLCLVQPFAVPDTLLRPDVLQAIAWDLALVTATVLAFRRSKTGFFALAWIVVAMAPLSNLLPLGRPIAEARAYAPSVGFCLLVAFALTRIPQAASPRLSRRWVAPLPAALALVLVAVYGGLTVRRNRDWRTNVTLYTDTLAKNPSCWAAHRGLALIYSEQGRPNDAIRHLRSSLVTRPKNEPALEQLVRLCHLTGRPDEAKLYAVQLLFATPTRADGHLRLGGVHLELGRLVEAEDHLGAALRYDPTLPRAHQCLGYVRLLQQRYPEALAEFREAQRLGLDDAAAHHALGMVYARMERHREAVAEFHEAVRPEPEREQSWAAMAQSYEALGDGAAAVRCYRRCLELGGSLADAARRAVERLAPEEE
ncbi:MAG: tetratricopeptide repeat protein [Armatimonadota bacterium]|jgi:Tfp pilus assembly protein PilF